MKKLLFISSFILSLLLCQCTSTSNITRYIVASTCVDCMGVVPQKCMMVKKGDAQNWELFYSKIDGFKYEPGYEYVLDVKEEKIENPPADGSSIKFTLIKQVSKIAKTAEPSHVNN